MAKLNYKEQANALSEAIDIAIDSVKKFPPKGFDETHLNHFITTYLEFKNNALNPEPQYRNSQSLAYIKSDVFTYFQEGSGDAVNDFWKQVGERNLGFLRENKLVKILKREKIKNRIEYDFLIDVIVPYQQEGLINAAEAKQLAKMLAEFEKKMH